MPSSRVTDSGAIPQLVQEGERGTSLVQTSPPASVNASSLRAAALDSVANGIGGQKVEEQYLSDEFQQIKHFLSSL